MVKVSYKMTGKLEDIPAINTNPISNPFCDKMHNSKDKNSICTHCYSFYMLRTFRQHMVESLERNSKELSEGILSYDNCPEIKNRIFVRFNAHGELINETHLINLICICIKNPLTTFVLWTKRKDIVEKYFKRQPASKVDNLILVYSNPNIDTIVNPFYPFDKTFNISSKDNRYVNCRGKCIDCLKCYTRGKFKYDSIIVEKLKTYGKEK